MFKDRELDLLYLQCNDSESKINYLEGGLWRNLGIGNQQMNMNLKKTLEAFKSLHGFRYDYY